MARTLGEALSGGMAAVRRFADPDNALSRAWAPGNQANTALFAGALLLLLTAALFGGASQTNALSLMAVELASLPLLFMSAYLALAGGLPKGSAAPLALLAAVAAVPILQLVPLPASWWTRLPGREAVVAVLDLTKLGRPSEPLSLAPQETWRSALALGPPIAMFLGVLMLSDRQRRVMAVVWLALGVLSLCIGVLQLLGGSASPFYFYEITNAGSAVGLFSNRNHEAEFLLCLVPVAAVFAVRFTGRFEDWRSIPPLLAVLYVFVAIVGVAATRSRAGVFLLAVALAGGGLVLMKAGALGRGRWRAAAGAGAGAAVAIAAVLLLGLSPILARFGGPPDPRFQDWPVVLAAARSFLPLGSGVGSFQAIYNSVEPLGHVSPIYFNHAHNDYLELWLETGVAGAALAALFAVWLASRLWAIWGGRIREPQAALPAALSLTVLLLLAHSTVDYPLRTEGLAVLFAFACATVATYVRGAAPAPGPSAALRAPEPPAHREGRRRVRVRT